MLNPVWGCLRGSLRARASFRRALALMPSLFALLPSIAMAQVKVDDYGHPGYNIPFTLPPGIHGMVPKLSLSFSDNAATDILGVGWQLDGYSFISRCSAIRDTDGVVRPAQFGVNDKLCIDGQRLIQTDANGNPTSFPQTGDAVGGGSGAYVEYRTEIDGFTRVRAYGYASGTAASGPAWFRVWTNDGRVHDYGASPNVASNANALLTVNTVVGGVTQTVAISWFLARSNDAFGNVIDYKYTQRDFAWGSGITAGSPTPGHEWLLSEIQYSGNKVLLGYDDTRPDKRESYRLGIKSVAVARLNSITAYTNASNTGQLGVSSAAVAVRTMVMSYEQGAVSQRSRLKSVHICAGGPQSTACMPPTKFAYSDGGDQRYTSSANFANSLLATSPLYNAAGTRGVLVSDFNGEGRSDLLVWDDVPANNALYLSDGRGGFTKSAAFTTTGTGDNIFKSDGCFTSTIVDINNDGLPDIFRYAGLTDIKGKGCPPGGVSQIYFNNGDGSFTARSISIPVSLNRMLSQTSVPYDGSKEGWTAGLTFYILDVDGDGFPDIITSARPDQTPVYPAPPPPPSARCAIQNCTHVYRGDGTGNFVDVTASSNLLHIDTYTDPDFSYSVASVSRVQDGNGDGLADLATSGGVYLSNGDFTFTQAGGALCDRPLDFNGDGRLDCVGQFLLLGSGINILSQVAGYNLGPIATTSAGFGLGTIIGDFNDDGRDDILIATDAPGSNVLYLSNGDGTFSASTSFNLNTAADQLASADKTTATLLGDFTGSGHVEMLRLADSPTSGQPNRLYVKADNSPVDRLLTVTTPSGSKTSISYTFGAGLDGRYASDRGTPFRANSLTDKRADTVPRDYLVKTVTTDSGVGTSAVAHDYAYFGEKFSLVGRGNLGFRETRMQTLAGDGQSPLTVSTSRSQDFPYIGRRIGMASYLSAWSAIASSSQMTWEATLLCDVRSGADPNAATAAGKNCARGSNKLMQPYMMSVTDGGYDIDGVRTKLTTKTELQVVNASGLVTRLAESWSAVVAGSAQTYTSTNTANAQPDVTTCSDSVTCLWQVGRASSTTFSRSVPTTILATQAGTAQNATATQGNVTVSLSGVGFGNVTVGAVPMLNATLSNQSGSAVSVVAVGASSVTGTGFAFVSTTCGTTLSPSSSCTVSISMAPTAASAYSGSLTIGTGAGSKTSALTGTGVAPDVVIHPALVNWGTVGIASDSGDWPTIVNNSAVPVRIISTNALSGPSGVYAWQGDSSHCQPGITVLSPHGSCQTFFGIGTSTAVSPGAYGALYDVAYQAVGVTTATFHQQQAYSFSAATTSAASSGLSFGNVRPGTTSGAQTFTVSNNAANSPVNLTVSVTGAQTSSFPWSTTCGSSLPSSGSCNVTVAFAPAVFSNGMSATVQVGFSYPRMQAGVASGYYPLSQSIAVPASGNGAGSSISFSPTSYAYGTQYTSNSYNAVVTVTNNGNLATVGFPGAFQATGVSLSGTCVNELAAGASCTLASTWSPTLAGAASGAVTNNAPSGGSASAWTWTGTAVVPTFQAFTMTSSTGRSTTFQNGNSAAVAVTGSGVTTTNNGVVIVNSNTCTGTMAAGASCTIVFSPVAPGCSADNFSSTASVSNAGGTTLGTAVKSTSSKTCN
jgi:hypothetical protein